MTDDLKKTIRLQRPTREMLGMEEDFVPEESTSNAEFELVSTQQLFKILEADNADLRKDLEEVAQGKDGVLAMNIDDDSFEIIDEADVVEALKLDETTKIDLTDPDSPALETTSANEDVGISLVSTMMLKRALTPEGQAELTPIDEEMVNFKNSGFDPYNSS